jgi:hypothetical protein
VVFGLFCPVRSEQLPKLGATYVLSTLTGLSDRGLVALRDRE